MSPAPSPAPTTHDHEGEPAVGALLVAIASLGVRVQSVALPPESSVSAGASAPEPWGARLTLSDASTIRCDPRTAIAVARHVGVPA